MSTYALANLSDSALLRDLATLVARDRTTTAQLLAHLAEVDARGLYRPAAYPSMYAYCVGELHLSEEAAFKRIHAARAARQFPAIFAAIADGRLHLSAVILLAPCLTSKNADELLAAAAHQSKAAIERLLAERFPRPDQPTRIVALTPSAAAHDSGNQHAPGRVEDLQLVVNGGANVAAQAPALVDVRPRMTPLAPERFALQVTISQGTRDKLRYAQELLGHQIAPGDVAQVLDRALDALIHQLEKTKFAATDRPRRPGARTNPDSRHISDEVKRAVWARDRGQCTFVSEGGHRCEARTDLQFDHVDAFARGGSATVSGIRLRCRAHNQLDAERTFGAEFMRHKRIAAAEARTERNARAGCAPAEPPHVLEVVPWLRALGFRADEAKRAAALCEAMPDATLEARVRRALSYFKPRGTRVIAAPAAVAPTTSDTCAGTSVCAATLPSSP